MNLHSIILVLVIALVYSVNSTIRFVLDEELKNCGDTEWKIDISDFQLILINDTTSIANGTLRLIEEIESPWILHFYGEMYDRGHWHKKFERKFTDYCDYILKPSEMWYSEMMKRLDGKPCPYPKDTIFKYDEEIINYDVSLMPPTFEGRWRLIVEGYLGCMEIHFDFIDD